MDAKNTKPAFHQSILSGLSKCAMQVRYRYVDGLKVPPGVALLVGTAVHRAIDEDLVAKVTTGSALPLEAVKGAARDALVATWDGEPPMLDEDEKSRGAANVKAEAVDQAVALADCASRELTPLKDPVSKDHIERRLRLELVGFPFDLEGTIDLQEKGGKLTDFKTAARAPSEGEASGNVQLDTYALMVKTIDGEAPKSVELNVLVKTKKAKLEIRSAPAPSTFDHIAQRIERAAHIFETDSFFPVDPKGPSGWVCGPRFCGFWDSHCPFGRRALTTFQAVQVPGGASS